MLYKSSSKPRHGGIVLTLFTQQFSRVESDIYGSKRYCVSTVRTLIGQHISSSVFIFIYSSLNVNGRNQLCYCFSFISPHHVLKPSILSFILLTNTTFYTIHSFLIRSTLVIPLIRLSILISATLVLCSPSSFRPLNTPDYNMIGLTALCRTRFLVLLDHQGPSGFYEEKTKKLFVSL